MDINVKEHCKKLLNAIPLIVFIVDDDVRIRDLNDAARGIFGLDKETFLNCRGGEVLHCLHAYDVPEGCGRAPLCKDCIIRNSVVESLKGQTVTRRRTRTVLVQEGKKRELDLLITACPVPDCDELLALLIIEDISELTSLKTLIPICSNCKKIRDDQKFWKSVESYFNEYIGVDFTHGLCPDCLRLLYPDFAISEENEEGKKQH